MRSGIAWMLALSVLACGSPAIESAGEPVGVGEPVGESEGVGEPAGESEAESEHPPASARTAATASCDRVRPCMEAFLELAPAALAAPARIALTQLEASLVETSAREPACRAAIDSYRHDLEAQEVAVPDACR